MFWIKMQIDILVAWSKTTQRAKSILDPSSGHIRIFSIVLEDIMGKEIRYEDKCLSMASNT